MQKIYIVDGVFMRRVKVELVEIAVLVALAFTLLWGTWSLQSQDRLAGQLIRLHVIAHSDAPAVQQLKLQVRDAVLEEARQTLQQAGDRETAQETIRQTLSQLEKTAAEEIAAAGYDYPVSVRLEQTEFPHKDYESFSLPSGEYLALRVVIGEGAGENWWCVVYPPLCMTAATDMEETAITCGMDREQVELMKQKNTGYVVKFRSLELWEQLRQWLSK